MAIQFENTDTFGGEANYCWVKRAHILKADGLTDRQLVRRAKAWAGYTGMRCEVSTYGDAIEIRPRGVCQVLFVNYAEEEHVQGGRLDA